MKRFTFYSKQVLAVVAMSTLMVILFEGALRIISLRKPMYTIEMVKYAKRLKEKDPLGIISHVHKPNSSAKLMNTEIKLNSLGHRNEELLLNKPENERRVFVLGSSVTMGWGVDQEKVFTQISEDRLNYNHPFNEKYHFRFANAGTGNYNTINQYEIFKRQINTVQPDFVVLHYFINDAEPTTIGNQSKIYQYLYLATYLYDWYHKISFSLFKPNRDLANYYRSLYESGNPNWEHTLKLISQMKERTDQKEIPFWVTIVPDFHNLSSRSPYGSIYRVIEEAFNQRGIKNVNLFPVFQARYGQDASQLWIQPDDPHPNAKGHELMADVLYEYIVRENPMKLEKNSQSPTT